MIIQEKVVISGRMFVKTFSDAGRYVERDGQAYEAAFDPVGYERQYTEGDNLPDVDPAEALEILLGGGANET